MEGEEQVDGRRGEDRQLEGIDLEAREEAVQRQGRMTSNMINDIMNLIQ